VGRLDGKVALITGGASGIGLATARRFIAEGARVAIADRDDAASDRAVAEAGVTASVGDVTDWAFCQLAVEGAIAAHGRLDVLVNNAGVSVGDGVLETDPETWDLNLAIVLKSQFLVTKAALPHLLAAGRGAIVNVSSVNGLLGLGEEGYSAAKAGVINFTQNLAVRYGPKGLRANCVCPGSIRTPIWRNTLAKEPRVFERLAPWYPLGRVGEAEEVANAILFLASDEASFVSGAILTVDGGLTAGLGRMRVDLQGE
jgi:meso-butanediol dehydrogenase/(S,S)-butanediol dehydrogenase/diacetyl reductase